MAQLYVGLDVHSKFCVYVVMSEGGEVLGEGDVLRLNHDMFPTLDRQPTGSTGSQAAFKRQDCGQNTGVSAPAQARRSSPAA